MVVEQRVVVIVVDVVVVVEAAWYSWRSCCDTLVIEWNGFS